MVAGLVLPAHGAVGRVQRIQGAVERPLVRTPDGVHRRRRGDIAEGGALPQLLTGGVEGEDPGIDRSPVGGAPLVDDGHGPHGVGGLGRPLDLSVRADGVGLAAGVPLVDGAVRSDIRAALPPGHQLGAARGRWQRLQLPDDALGLRHVRIGPDPPQDLVARAQNQRLPDARLCGQQRGCRVDDAAGGEAPHLLPGTVQAVQDVVGAAHIDGPVC